MGTDRIQVREPIDVAGALIALALLGLSITVGGALCGTLGWPYQPLSTVPSNQFWAELRELGAIVVAVPIIVALLAAIAAAVFRLVAYRVIERDGDLCARCGYRLVESTTARCPECGLDDPARVVGRPLATRVAAAVGRRRALWSTLVVGLILGAIVWIAVLEAPFVRFNRTFGEWRGGVPVVIEEIPGSPWVLGVRRESPVGGGLHLSVDASRATATSPIRLWLRLTDSDLGSPPRTPPVILELHGRDIRRVLRDGVPEATIERMRAAHAARDAPTQVLWLDGGLDD